MVQPISKSKYILFFNEISVQDKTNENTPSKLVGGKNASLAEMYQHLVDKGINIPYGFAITIDGYSRFIEYNAFNNSINQFLETTGKDKTHMDTKQGEGIRNLIISGKIPEDLENEIYLAYTQLSEFYKVRSADLDVAVRSSSVSEDSVTSSFAGQQDTFLNISGITSLLLHIKRCFASLFTDRVLVYRDSHNINDVKMSICVQKMVRSDCGASGVLFTIDTESGFRDAIVINASYGLGELIVGGTVDPDEYTIFKKTGAIIDKKLGNKKEKLIYNTSTADAVDKNSTVIISTTREESRNFCLQDHVIEQLGSWGSLIEQHYGAIHGCPVDIEWAFDGVLNKLFIVQARPVTTSNQKNNNILSQYRLKDMSKRAKLVTGVAVGDRIATGKVRRMHLLEDIHKKEFKQGDILVVDSTTPDWEPIMKIAAGIITNRGGRTCHAAIIAREQGLPAIVGTDNALSCLLDDQIVTMSCAEGEIGNVYEGPTTLGFPPDPPYPPYPPGPTTLGFPPDPTVPIDYDIIDIDFQSLKIKDRTSNIVDESKKIPQIMFNLANPEIAFKTAIFPNSGVGLAREEFIINNFLKIHPLALLNYDFQEIAIRDQIDRITVGYKNGLEYYVEKLAFGIAKIAAAFYPNDVILRFSDFKSNEYRNLLGGAKYEPTEENPMIGWRGASRYYSPDFSAAFGLECQAIKRVREQMNLTNVVVMIPFCRTPEELLKVYETMQQYGLKRGVAGLRVFLMAEIPSNCILADEFSKHIDGFSIGSNDLTQLTLGLDRDSHLVSHIYDERNSAVKAMISMVIKAAKRNGIKCGICGSAPSDKLDFVEFLIEEGIDSISITPDALPKTVNMLNKVI